MSRLSCKSEGPEFPPVAMTMWMGPLLWVCLSLPRYYLGGLEKLAPDLPFQTPHPLNMASSWMVQSPYRHPRGGTFPLSLGSIRRLRRLRPDLPKGTQHLAGSLGQSWVGKPALYLASPTSPVAIATKCYCP
jgi:hypothetical protein